MIAWKVAGPSDKSRIVLLPEKPELIWSKVLNMPSWLATSYAPVKPTRSRWETTGHLPMKDKIVSSKDNSPGNAIGGTRPEACIISTTAVMFAYKYIFDPTGFQNDKWKSSNSSVSIKDTLLLQMLELDYWLNKNLEAACYVAYRMLEDGQSLISEINEAKKEEYWDQWDDGGVDDIAQPVFNDPISRLAYSINMKKKSTENASHRSLWNEIIEWKLKKTWYLHGPNIESLEDIAFLLSFRAALKGVILALAADSSDLIDLETWDQIVPFM